MRLAETPDCLLPCWAGLIPGRTTLTEVSEFLASISADPYAYKVALTAAYPEPLAYAWSGLDADGQFIGLDSVTFFWKPDEPTIKAIWLSYVPAPVAVTGTSSFARFGFPDRIGMAALTNGDITLALSFQSTGVDLLTVTSYDWPLFCLTRERTWGAEVILYDPPSSPLPIENVATELHADFEALSSVTHWTGLTEAEFARELQMNGGCIELVNSS